MSRARSFSAELALGHKGVTVVMVPFDPEVEWRAKPVKLDPRRDGWLVAGTLNDMPFEGYIGQRWGRFFIIVEPSLRELAGLTVGGTLAVVVKPTRAASALATAPELSQMTTAPRRGRPDAVDPDPRKR